MIKRFISILAACLLLSGCSTPQAPGSSAPAQPTSLSQPTPGDSSQKLISYTHIVSDDTGIYLLGDAQSDPFSTMEDGAFYFCQDDNNAMSFGFPLSGWALSWDAESGYLTCQPADDETYSAEFILLKKLEGDYASMTDEAIRADVASRMDALAAQQLGPGIHMTRLEPFLVPAGTCLEMVGTLASNGESGSLSIDMVALISGQTVYFCLALSRSEHFTNMQNVAAAILTNFQPIQIQSSGG